MKKKRERIEKRKKKKALLTLFNIPKIYKGNKRRANGHGKLPNRLPVEGWEEMKEERASTPALMRASRASPRELVRVRSTAGEEEKKKNIDNMEKVENKDLRDITNKSWNNLV